MKNFRDLLEEVNYTLGVLMLFDTILNGAIVFLASYLVLDLFNINGYFGLIPAGALFLWEAIKRLRKNKLKLVEGSYDFLSEKLRTARDYLNTSNPFVDDLQEEIAGDINKVESSTFFDEKKTYMKTGAIAVLCILLLVLAPYHFVLFNFGNMAGDIIKRELKNPIIPGGQKEAPSLVSVEDDWYGEFSVATLGDENMQIQLLESDYKLTSDVVQDPEAKQFNDVFPGTVQDSQASAYKANIAKENQEIVKNYFKEISK